MKKILYLYSEIAPYNIPIFEVIASKYDYEVHVIRWTSKLLKPYEPPKLKNVFYYDRQEFDADSILSLSKELSPELIYVSGWMDKGYFPTLKYFKKIGVPVVTGFDDQWIGSQRQYLGTVYYRLFLSKYYTHAWVAGVRQYEFARRLGFRQDNIIFDMLSCDFSKFSNVKLKEKEDNYFVYVGNLRHVKGTDILIDAFNEYRDNLNGSWKLLCIGNGDLQTIIDNQRNNDNIISYDFLSQDRIIQLLSKNSVFVLPSRLDQWGVVVHEFAALGLPMILSKSVGAKTSFFIENYNGFSFDKHSSTKLAAIMKKFECLDNTEFKNMAVNSKLLSLRITPETSVANLLSVVGKK